MNCGTCGDKLTLPGDPHECWVWMKAQEPSINTPCCVCGLPEYGGLTHRECYPEPHHSFYDL